MIHRIQFCLACLTLELCILHCRTACHQAFPSALPLREKLHLQSTMAGISAVTCCMQSNSQRQATNIKSSPLILQVLVATTSYPTNGQEGPRSRHGEQTLNMSSCNSQSNIQISISRTGLHGIIGFIDSIPTNNRIPLSSKSNLVVVTKSYQCI
jgi:hypothetical protein